MALSGTHTSTDAQQSPLETNLHSLQMDFIWIGITFHTLINISPLCRIFLHQDP